MTADDIPAAFSLKRWSRRKLEAARATPASATPPAAVTLAPAVAGSAPAAHSPASAPPVPADLPPIASLSFESDFSVFLQPKVEAALTRQALKKLFSDPRFNVMDGLDTYIDDYSKPDPISAEVVREMMQSRYIFNPPQTRVNAEGFVEDVPAEETAAAAEPAATAGTTVESAPSTALPLDASPLTPAVPAAAALPSDPQAATLAPTSEPKSSEPDPNRASPR